MKVLLVNPIRSPHNGILDHATDETLPFIHRKLIGPPLGLLTLATAIGEDADVALLELKAEYDLRPDAPPPRELVRQALERERPDVVGVTTIASEHNGAMDILGWVRELDPEILRVAGGLHATLCPEDYAGGPAQVICPGQSALVFRELVRARRDGRPLGEVAGLKLVTEEGLTATEGEPPPFEPAGRDYLVPDRSLVAPWLRSYVVGRSTDPATYLFSSLGCSYRCTFCSIWPQLRGRYLTREVESVVEELKGLDDYPVVRFADANSLEDGAFMERLFDRIIAEGIEKFFIMDLRTDAVCANPGLVEKMARGGLKVVISGFESFRDEELTSYRKTAAADQIHEAIGVLHENGIMIRGNYVVPPSYGDDDFDALAEYAASHRVAYAGYTILTPMPGTVLHNRVKGEIADPDLDKYNFFNCVLEPRLPLERFYRRVAALWGIKEGSDVI